jgi:glucose-6-phosphate 1-epimerase
MWNVRYQRNPQGLQAIILEHSVERTSCSIFLHGCTVSSWVVRGTERLFVSSRAVLDGSKAIRGGIPVVFPQFAQPLPSLPQHGFARTSTFEEVTHEFGEESVTAVFSLGDCKETLQIWPHKFKLEYIVTLSEGSLECALRVRNTGLDSFQIHTLLHTYLRVPSIEATTVSGFYGKAYIDKVNGCVECVEENAVSVIDREVDRVFIGRASADRLGPIRVQSTADCSSPDIAYSPVMVSVTAELDSSSALMIPHDIVFWNPWVEKSRALADLGDDDYKHFLCVEPGTVSEWISVPPDATLTLTQCLQVAEA